MLLGVGGDSSQSAHMVVHLMWQHNIAEVLLDFVTGFPRLSSSLPEPAARGVANQLGRAQPSAQGHHQVTKGAVQISLCQDEVYTLQWYS